MRKNPLAAAAGDFLVVIDFQRDFCPGGKLAVPDGDAVAVPIRRLVSTFPQIVMTQDWHPADHRSFASQHAGASPFETCMMPYGTQVLWPDHCVQGTPGAEFHPALDIDAAQLILRKGFRREIDSYSAFCENDRSTPTGLGGYLRERGCRRVVLAGLALDFCVHYSAIDARQLGFEVVIVQDACRAIDTAGSLDAAMSAFAAAGVVLA